MGRALLSLIILSSANIVSAQKNDYVLECLEILFVKDRFDSPFYKRKPHEDIICFFALKDSTVERFLNVQDFEEIPHKFKNGNLFSIQPRSYLFSWGADYFVRFISYSFTDEKIVLVFEERHNNGFKEKVLRTREVVFIKKDRWQLMNEKWW